MQAHASLCLELYQSTDKTTKAPEGTVSVERSEIEERCVPESRRHFPLPREEEGGAGRGQWAVVPMSPWVSGIRLNYRRGLADQTERNAPLSFVGYPAQARSPGIAHPSALLLDARPVRPSTCSFLLGPWSFWGWAFSCPSCQMSGHLRLLIRPKDLSLCPPHPEESFLNLGNPSLFMFSPETLPQLSHAISYPFWISRNIIAKKPSSLC